MTDLTNEKLKFTNQLLIEGLYFKALDTLKEFEHLEDHNSENCIFYYHLKSNISLELGRYSDALKLAEKAYNMSQELGMKPLLVDSCISKARALLSLRDYDLVLQLVSKGEELLKEFKLKPYSEYTRREALLKLIKSDFCFYKSGNIDKALEYGEQGLKILEEHDNKEELALALQLNSIYHFVIGNLDQALSLLERCLRVQKTYRKRIDWRTFKDLGVLNGMRGELDVALEYTKQGLECAEELDNKSFVAQCLNNSSLIYRQKGKLDAAINALERTLTIWEETGNKLRFLGGLDSLFVVSLDANSLEKAQNYLLRMQQINAQVKNKVSDVACRVNEALMLKMSSKSLDQEKAKKILQDIVKGEIINWEFTERALLHLCDIFLLELQKYNKQEVLSEINLLINRLLDFANSQNSYRLLAEINLLQGKLALIQMNLGDARKLFTKAERIADDHGLHLLARAISTEHDKLLEQLDKWEELRKGKAPVSERLKFVEIDKTLDHMMGGRMIEPPDLVEEDPILLLIMNEDGNSYFIHTFIKDWDYKDLFSSFISAFNTFSSEIFSKTIDRIKIGENIIFIKPIEPYFTCYVSKGQSYPAIKKLNKFSESIKANAVIWEKIQNAAKASRELTVDNLPVLGNIVNEIFGH